MNDETLLRLRDSRELFEQPERSPLDDYESWGVGPGAEYLFQLVRGNLFARLALELPAPADHEWIRGALARYAIARAEEVSREIRAEALRALSMLLPTGIVFALTLGRSRLADSSSSHWLSGTIAEALAVIGWVVLWSPSAIHGTDICALRGRRRAYRRLVALELDVRVAPS